MATKDLTDAVLGGTQKGAPSPFSDTPEVDALYAPEFAAVTSNAATKAPAYNDAVAVANAKAAQRAALEAKAQAQADLADPSKYQRLPKDDGGYSFVAPDGKEISAYDYARITGNSIDSVLKDSLNPIDVGFQQDYSNLQKFLTAVSSGDTATANSFIKQAPELERYRNDVQGLMDKFRQAYPTVFGQGGFQGKGTAGQPLGSSLVPSVQGGGSSIADLLSQYGVTSGQ